ncbi:MAG: hypothetical protein L6461_23365, partial [Anaerolineae bacterium]|nr:hypothetical protein [Anaerolineae bacterium]
PSFTATPAGVGCEFPAPQPVPPDFMRTLNYGKDYVENLQKETRGFWYADPNKPYDARMQIAVGYYYEGSQFYRNADMGNAVTEAFARKYYYEANQYGSENGLYRALGTLQSIRDRINRIRRNPDNPDNILKEFELIPGDYHDLDYAYEQAERILNSPDPSWCNGILLDRPAAWGDVWRLDNNLRSILPEFMDAVTSENQGEKPNQIYRIQYEPVRDRFFFVMTQAQFKELCFNGSCVAPDPDYVNEQRRLRGK